MAAAVLGAKLLHAQSHAQPHTSHTHTHRAFDANSVFLFEHTSFCLHRILIILVWKFKNPQFKKKKKEQCTETYTQARVPPPRANGSVQRANVNILGSQ